jgi:excisionase family DNA binding protein
MSGNEGEISLGEAARRLGVSVPTARRMVTDGRLEGRKVGKRWLVDPGRLGRTRPTRRATSTSPVDLERSLTQVRNTDLTEAWVPDVLRWEDHLELPGEVLRHAQERFDGGVVDPLVEVEIDKSPFFTRSAALLSLEDRVAFNAAVGSIADRIDALTPDNVYSARVSRNPEYLLLHGTRQWVAWREEVLGQVNGGLPWMIKTDITAYFDHIPHRLLMAEVQSLNPDPRVVDALNEMLRSWATLPGLGLPQGPNASRLLANLFLVPVDRAMIAAGVAYYRYMDDVRIVGRTKADVILGIRLFERECRRRGLMVSAGKTKLLEGDSARADLSGEPDIGTAAYLMSARAMTLAKRLLKQILRRALKAGDGHIDGRRARFSLWRLARLGEPGPLRRVLARLDDLAPVSTVVAAYLRPFVDRKSVVDGLAAFLADDSRSHSTYLSTWLFAAMLERQGALPAPWADQAARRVKDRNQPPYLRAVAAIVMARGGRAADIDWLKADIAREHDPTVLRGYAVALHWVRQLDATTQRRMVARFPNLARTTAYLKGRTTLPSLIVKDRSARLRL